MRSIEHGTVLLGKYRVESIIGRGGMGLVVKARHLGLDEQVAIKMLRNDVPIAEETITRFVREAQAAVRLKGEHIARITDVGTFEDGKPYMVMEYLEGQDIGQLITERGWLQPSLAIELVIQACEALAEAHSLGIVHRDIKPTNLFLTSRPDGSVLLKVLDFGISKAPAGAELALTQTWSLLGTPAYMSPEQMRSARHVDARTDVWSLGAVLYEALEGHLPFQADSFSEMCVMVAVDPPTPMTETPRELVPIISRCLAKTPDERYPNVAALARDLARLAREPDKAQILVDRIDRMLGRGVMKRTPPAGIPQLWASPDGCAPDLVPTAAALPSRRRPATLASQSEGDTHATKTAPVSRSHLAPRSSHRSPFGDLPDGFTPATLATGTPPLLATGLPPSPAPRPVFGAPHPPGPPPASVLTRSPAPTPSSWVPHSPESTRARGLPRSAAQTPVGVPLFVPSAPGPQQGPRASQPYPSHSPYPLPLPEPLHGEARYLRPGLQLPRGAPEALTTTQVIARPDRGWIVAAVTAVVALAAALAVVAATRTEPKPRRPGESAPVVRMNPIAAPSVSPITDSSVAPADPTVAPAAAGSGATSAAPSRMPGDHED